ncbi:MAG: MFS transporter [Coxiellaceae bacterium]|nr:MFS transporter [Coxiellaceae bacterium]
MTKQKLGLSGMVWLRGFMFFLAAFFVFYDILIQVSPGVLTKEIMRELNIGAAGLGALSGIYFWTYCGMQIPAGLLFDRFKVNTTLFIPILMTAVGIALFAYTDQYWLAAVARLLMGAGSAFAFIGAARVAADVFSPKVFPILVGVIYVLAALGALFSQTILVQVDAIFGWKYSLLGLGAAGCVLAVLCWLIIRYPRKQRVKHESTSMWTGLIEVMRERQTWYIAAVSFATWGPMTMFASLWGTPFLMRVYGFDKPTAAGLVAASWMGLAVSSPLLGWASNMLGNRKQPLVFSSVLGLVASLLIVFFVHLNHWQLATLLFLMGVACAAQPLTYTLAKETNDKRHAAVAIAFNNMACIFSGVILQPLSGWLISLLSDHRLVHGVRVYTTGDYQLGLSLLPAIFVISLLFSWFCVKETFCHNHSG